MMKKFLVSGLLATSLSFTAAAGALAQGSHEGGARMQGRLPMMPIAGEVVAMSNDSFTMSISDVGDHARVKAFLDKMGLSAGEKVTVKVTAETKILEKTQEVSLTNFTVGEKVFVVGNLEGTNMLAKLVSDTLPKQVNLKGHGRMGGEVTAINTSGNTLMVTGRNNEEHTIVFNEDTKFYVDGEVQTENDVSVGDIVKVKARFDKELKQIVATTITVVGVVN